MAQVSAPVVYPARAGEPRRLPMARLSRHSATRQGLIAAANGVLSAKVGSSQLDVEVIRAGAEQARLWVFEFQVGADMVQLHCPRRLVMQLLQSSEPGLAPEEATPGLLALLVDTLLQSWLTAWHSWAGRPVRFLGMREATVVDGAIALQFNLGGGTSYGALSGGPTVDRILSSWPSRPNPLSQLCLPCRIWVGTTDLPMLVVSSIQVGDAILVEAQPKNGPMLRVADGWGAGLKRDGVRLLLTEAVRPLQTSDGERTIVSNKIEPASRSADTLADVPIRLSFDVGHMELPLGEVRRLQAGSILSTGHGPSELVDISANGRRVGTGELVDVEGVVAVRITRLFGLD